MGPIGPRTTLFSKLLRYGIHSPDRRTCPPRLDGIQIENLGNYAFSEAAQSTPTPPPNRTTFALLQQHFNKLLLNFLKTRPHPIRVRPRQFLIRRRLLHLREPFSIFIIFKVALVSRFSQIGNAFLYDGRKLIFPITEASGGRSIHYTNRLQLLRARD